MTNDDFRRKFEQHRKEIAATDDTDAADKPLTRAELFGHKEPSAGKRQKAGRATGKNRPRGSTLINTLLILFMLIPISLFIYVYKFYDPMDSSDAAELEQDFGVETSIAGEDAKPPAEGGAATDADEQEAEEQEEKQRQEEQKRQEEQQKQEEQRKQEEQKKLEEQKRQEEQQRLEEQKRQEEQARIAEQKKREEQQRLEQQRQEREKEKQQAGRGSHTVQPGETLYRISVNYYGSGDGVEKIKRANGLSSNEISVGQTLIIP